MRLDNSPEIPELVFDSGFKRQSISELTIGTDANPDFLEALRELFLPTFDLNVPRKQQDKDTQEYLGKLHQVLIEAVGNAIQHNPTLEDDDCYSALLNLSIRQDSEAIYIELLSLAREENVRYVKALLDGENHEGLKLKTHQRGIPALGGLNKISDDQVLEELIIKRYANPEEDGFGGGGLIMMKRGTGNPIDFEVVDPIPIPNSETSDQGMLTTRLTLKIDRP